MRNKQTRLIAISEKEFMINEKMKKQILEKCISHLHQMELANDRVNFIQLCDFAYHQIKNGWQAKAEAEKTAQKIALQAWKFCHYPPQ